MQVRRWGLKSSEEVSELGKGRNSVEHDQKLIRPEEAHSEFAHQIWAQSEQ